jgi:sporulation protein YlmC with PRC-barrel domain
MNPKGEYDAAGGSPRVRLHDLLGLPVLLAGGDRAGYVNDVRLAPSDRRRGRLPELVTEGLVVGRRRNGTLLGYDRRQEQGPLVVRAVLRVLHRHTGYVPWSSVREVDLESGEVRLGVDSLRPLLR